MYKKRTRTTLERANRAISTVLYFAGKEVHTLSDAEKDLGLSKMTIQRDFEELASLLYYRSFPNPEIEKEMIIAYKKAKKRLASNRHISKN